MNTPKKKLVELRDPYLKRKLENYLGINLMKPYIVRHHFFFGQIHIYIAIS